MTDLTSILFNAFLAASTVFVVAAIIAIVRLLRTSPRRETGAETRTRTVELAREEQKTITEEEEEAREKEASLTAAESTETGYPAERATVSSDDFSYERSGFYKWFNAQMQKLKKDKEKREE
jgi:hypothetical protein